MRKKRIGQPLRLSIGMGLGLPPENFVTARKGFGALKVYPPKLEGRKALRPYQAVRIAVCPNGSPIASRYSPLAVLSRVTR
ncbi:MAG: hypothetical protein RRB24_03185 [Armatimonadota bacterium]|nr:hypothetical protein [Armatimonadota bacterium]MDT7971810.1 hypothetical protein [Armatimonadota bacterium]